MVLKEPARGEVVVMRRKGEGSIPLDTIPKGAKTKSKGEGQVGGTLGAGIW
jgi:hypothetical protein